MQAQRGYLVILDMNGVLLHRSGRRAGNAQIRPHLATLLQVFAESRGKLLPAVWSSMARHNLRPLVARAFGEEAAGELGFCWGQEHCTRQWLKGEPRPLLRKDLDRLAGTVGIIPAGPGPAGG